MGSSIVLQEPFSSKTTFASRSFLPIFAIMVMAKSAVLFGFLIFSLNNLAFCARAVADEVDDDIIHVQPDSMGAESDGKLMPIRFKSADLTHPETPPAGTLEQDQATLPAS